MSQMSGDNADSPPGLMSIGEFAGLSGLSAKALRLYDESGLLVPFEVDTFNGYRRYSGDQLERARLVGRLRLVGMPLARIRLVADLPASAMVAELTSYARQLEADTATARQLISQLVSSLNAKEHDMTETAILKPRSAAREGIGARSTQEDAVLERSGLYAVADGVGDGAPGLSNDVLTVLAGATWAGDPLVALDTAITAAADMVASTYAEQPGAGCTLTAVLVRGTQAVLAHVGDCRAYLVRNGHLERWTRDHTVVQTLVDEGRLSPEEALADERRIQLNRAISAHGSHLPDLGVYAVRPGDRIVLTTDGVHGVLSAADLAAAVTGGADPDETVAEVEHRVLAAGAIDNYAVAVIDL